MEKNRNSMYSGCFGIAISFDGKIISVRNRYEYILFS